MPLVRRLLIALAVLAPIAWCFGRPLFTAECFVFRDAAHYYYPLFAWTSRQWAQGRVPLWNPQENCGVPVLADATSSVFYPGQLLFALPWDYATKYTWYIVGHSLLAAAAAYALARHWRASAPAAGLAAVSYALSGSVLFQYCNVVFLVGAAWLPLAILAADRMLVQRRYTWSLTLAVILALMILGGDPQAAYHTGQLAALLAVLRWRQDRVRAARSCHSAEEPRPGPALPASGTSWKRVLLVRHRLALLTVAGGAAWCLAAVQILPSSEWVSHSDRVVYDSPRNVYEIPEFLAQHAATGPRAGSVTAGLFGVPAPGTHHEHIYHFSVGPWHLAELVWPNFSGRTFPLYRRWTAAIPAEGRTWTPSLYQGLVPLWLALGACGLWRRSPPVRWAMAATLLGLAGSFGWYGGGWLLHELRCGLGGAKPDDVWLGQPVGGLYWLMVVLLPQYAQFRFPAKLLVVAALGLSQLAAVGCDRWLHRDAEGWRRGVWMLAGFSLLAGLATLFCGDIWEKALAHVPPDGLFGPLDAAGSLADLRGTLWHTALVAAAFGLLWRRGTSRPRGWTAATVLALTAVDLAVAQGWMARTAPRAAWQRAGYYQQWIGELDSAREPGSSCRVFRGARQAWLPAAWSQTSSPDRQREGLRWDRDTMFPRHHLTGSLSLVESYGTFSSYDYTTVLRLARRRGVPGPSGGAEPHRGVLDLLGAKYLLLPDAFTCPYATRLPDTLRPAPPPQNSALWLNPLVYPRAWIVHEYTVLAPLTDRTPAAVEQRTREILFPGGVIRNFRHDAVVEADAAEIDPPPAVPATLRTAHRPGDEWCRMIEDQPQRVSLRVKLTRPGLVVLHDFHYPGWVAGVHTGDQSRWATVLRVNRVLRGVHLPAGEYTLVFAYRPIPFYVGSILSGLAWLAVAGCVVALLAQRLRAAEGNRLARPPAREANPQERKKP